MTVHHQSTSTTAPVLTILGSRGSIPVSGRAFCRYGGNTTSMALSVGGEVFGFVDAGTALNSYRDHGLVLRRDVSVFLTHYHWDHIQGLSMLGEMWDGNCGLYLRGPGSPKDVLSRAISPPWFPVPLSDQDNLRFGGVAEPIQMESVTITSFDVNHPQGAVGYRIDGSTSSVVIITDHETTPESTKHLLVAARGVGTVIYDAQYLPGEMPGHTGWGHSSWEDAVRFASQVGADRLILTSHDPGRTDDAIDAVVSSAGDVFANTVAAVPGLTVEL